MIKLDRNFTPEFFSPENVENLTLHFKNTRAHVWQHQSVKDACLELGNNKCAFCEVILNQKSTYLEIEHFKDKDSYPDDVIQWENLLPACRHCNGTKGTHDVVEEPIINPTVHHPADHLFFKAYRIKGKTALGTMTEDVLNLNDSEHYVIERCRVGTFISEQLEEADKKFENYLNNPIPARKREVTKIARALLNQCQKSALFSAVSATVLHQSSEYISLRKNMTQNGIWTGQLEELHQSSLLLCLPSSR